MWRKIINVSSTPIAQRNSFIQTDVASSQKAPFDLRSLVAQPNNAARYGSPAEGCVGEEEGGGGGGGKGDEEGEEEDDEEQASSKSAWWLVVQKYSWKISVGYRGHDKIA